MPRSPDPQADPAADRRKRRLRRSRGLALALVAGMALVMAGLQAIPEVVLYRERVVLDTLALTSRAELRPLDMPAVDGLILRSWYQAPDAGKPVIVYFPGRRGDIVSKPDRLFDLAAEGYGLLLAGYRGYAGNPGRPNEARLYADAAGLLDALGEQGLAPDGIVLYGYSMGTGVASYLAATGRYRGLILEAPFTSFRDVVHQVANRFPLWLVRTRFDTRSRFAGIDVPILLLAGADDLVTPPSFAENLAAENLAHASLRVFAGAGHDTMFEHGAWEAVTEFLKSLVPEMQPQPTDGESDT